MNKLKAYKFRLYPNATQEVLLNKTFGCGVKNENLKLSDRVWTCGSCKVVNSRDFNAACRIEEEGRRLARLLM